MVLKTGPVIEPVKALIHGSLVRPWSNRGPTGLDAYYYFYIEIKYKKWYITNIHKFIQKKINKSYNKYSQLQQIKISPIFITSYHNYP